MPSPMAALIPSRYDAVGTPFHVGGHRAIGMIGAGRHMSDAGAHGTNPVMSLTILRAGEPQETVAFGNLLRYCPPEPMVAYGI